MIKNPNSKDGKHWTTDDINEYIKNKFVKGVKIIITSGAIHKEIGLINRHPMVCSAMKKLMKEYPNSEINKPKSGEGATFIVEYFP